MGKKKTTRGGEDDNPLQVTKSKKKNLVVDDDEYHLGTEEAQNQENSLKENEERTAPAFTGKKKGKKAVLTSDSHSLDDDDRDKMSNPNEEEPAPILFAGKKKPKSKKTSQSLFTASTYDALDNGDDDDKAEPEERYDNEETLLSFNGKKRSSKPSKKSNSTFAALHALDEDSDDLDEKPDDEDEPSIAFSGKKKSSKPTKKTPVAAFHALDDDGDGQAEDQVHENEPGIQLTGNNKSSKSSKKTSSSGFHAAEEEDEVAEKPEDEEETVISFYGKKKSSKSTKRTPGSGFHALEDDDEEMVEKQDDEEMVEKQDDEDEPLVFFSGKKSSKPSKKTPTGGFHALEEEDVEITEKQEDEDEPLISFSGKKKSSKSSKKTPGSGFHALEEDVDLTEKQEDEDDPVISFSGKKKSSKTSKKSPSLDEGLSCSVNEDEPTIAFSGKKKSAKASKKFPIIDEDPSVSFNGENENEIEENNAVTIAFSGKKKSSKNIKKSDNNKLSTTSTFETDLPEEDVQGSTDQKPNEEVMESEVVGSKDCKDVVEITKKQKKNKKKSARTAQEEEDLDKILEELGEVPSSAKADLLTPPQEERVQLQPEAVSNEAASEEKEGEAEVGESAAAKKKKKKKEKEKEKKAAAAAAAAASASAIEAKGEKTEEMKSKISDKKLPKHVREMQEALARHKEAEERKKREEEERLRKEEEERKRIEEAERLAEEAKRRKKEREKEKILKKKQEGKLLTGKQKEEARRLEAMRNQFLASGLVPSSETVIKKPKYERKKLKPGFGQLNGGPTEKEEIVEAEAQQETLPESEELVEVEKVEEETVAEEVKEVEEVAENEVVDEDEDEDEWDAKSWDDEKVVALPVKSVFEEEEEEEEKTTVKKITSNRVTAPASVDMAMPLEAEKVKVAPKKPAPAAPQKGQIAENKGKEIEVQAPVRQEKMTEVQAPEKQDKRTEATRTRDTWTAEPDSNKISDNLRSPICCILGHVDTGKTKLLDCIRGTNVQEGEAGGITQQIGATYFPAENIRERTKELKADAKLRVPGLLVIDTPGHESFTNLRSRGSGLCDIAILVVDIMHGLEPQTIESLNLLKMRNTEFIVALNKVDRLYQWKMCPNAPIVKAMKQQVPDVQNEFKMRLKQIITQFMEQGVNTELYYKNREMGQTFSIVPTSAITGEGIPDLLLLLVQWTQKTMEKKLMFSNEIECTVLEVKVVEGLGTTIDVVLVNGVLHEGDQIVVCGMQGPIVTSIRALLTPHPMKELRVKGTYQHHKELKAAQGVKIAAQGLEHAIAGTGLYVVGPDDDVEDIKDSTMQDMKSVMSRIDKSGEGVCVQASTLGSLEALLEFLKTPDVRIPVSGISIGPVHKKDIMRASVMLERKKEYAAILAFDVKVTPEARELADEMGVKIFCADIIYHLFDQFKAYIDNLKEEKKKEAAEEAVFPCVLKIMPNCIFNKKDPIVLGVDVLEGLAKVGTPLCVPSRDFIDIGRIASIEINHKQVDIAKKGQKVAMKIVGATAEEQQKMYGRHFEIDDELVSHISRRSIDVLKVNYREDLSNEEWRLVVKLKNLFKIQ